MPPRKTTRRTKKAAAPEVPASVPPAVEPEPLATDIAPIPTTNPEVAFAARVPAPEPVAPRPAHRHAVFIDVENNSRPAAITRLLEHIRIDRRIATVELVASGNWRVIGSETARLLARQGAQLVHSAPATGVRDWSDLRIAVAAGVWLASARTGDTLDIVSDDKAFDVVGDVAASLGVVFRRVSYRALAAESAPSVAAAVVTERPRRGRRPRRSSAAAKATEAPVVPEADAAAPSGAATAGEPADGVQGADTEDILRVVRELLAGSPSGVALDTVANRLKALGFTRPPGSPRLVTRLRRIRELDVSPRGHIRLRNGVPPPEAATATPPAAAGAPSGRKRRRRGGRRRSETSPVTPA